MRQYRSATDRYTLELPAGKVDPGEDPQEALDANCGEAAGYWLNATAHLGTLLTAPHFCDETLQVYLTTGEIKTQPQPMPRVH